MRKFNFYISFGLLLCLTFFAAPVLSEENPCLLCHSKFGVRAASVHPALSMGCDVCHQPVEGRKHPEKGSMKLKQNVPGLCYECHESKEKKRFIHAPVAAGQCSLCHNAHLSNNIALLPKSINNLCIDCHTNMARGRHMMAGFKNAHPTWGKPDPSRPGREMSCTSCHDPHASDFQNLVYQDRLCSRCHKF